MPNSQTKVPENFKSNCNIFIARYEKFKDLKSSLEEFKKEYLEADLEIRNDLRNILGGLKDKKDKIKDLNFDPEEKWIAEPHYELDAAIDYDLDAQEYYSILSIYKKELGSSEDDKIYDDINSHFKNVGIDFNESSYDYLLNFIKWYHFEFLHKFSPITDGVVDGKEKLNNRGLFRYKKNYIEKRRQIELEEKESIKELRDKFNSKFNPIIDNILPGNMQVYFTATVYKEHNKINKRLNNLKDKKNEILKEYCIKNVKDQIEIVNELDLIGGKVKKLKKGIETFEDRFPISNDIANEFKESISEIDKHLTKVENIFNEIICS